MDSGGNPEDALMMALLGEKVDKITLTNDQKAALWQMQNKSWKSKNNPYSTGVGQRVYDALNKETGSKEMSEEEQLLLLLLGK